MPAYKDSSGLWHNGSTGALITNGAFTNGVPNKVNGAVNPAAVNAGYKPPSTPSTKPSAPSAPSVSSTPGTVQAPNTLPGNVMNQVDAQNALNQAAAPIVKAAQDIYNQTGNWSDPRIQQYHNDLVGLSAQFGFNRDADGNIAPIQGFQWKDAGTPQIPGQPVVIPPQQLPIQSKAKLLSADELAKLYGITYDENAIKAKFDAATKAQYDMQRKDYQRTENHFYDQLGASQQTALDAIRKSSASAVATGASRGMQAANELSAVLGLQDNSVTGATDLVNQRVMLDDKEAADYAKNATTAMTTSNSLKQGLGTLASTLYAADTQFDVGQLDYYAKLKQAADQLAGVLSSNATNVINTNNTNTANKDIANTNKEGNVEVANINAQASRDVAQKNYDAAVKTGELNLQGQQAIANATMNAAKTAASAAKNVPAANGATTDLNQIQKDLDAMFYNSYKTGNYSGLIATLVRQGIAYDSAVAMKDDMIKSYEKAVFSKTPGTGGNFTSGGGNGGGGSSSSGFSVDNIRTLR